MRFLRLNTARFVFCLLVLGSAVLSSQMTAQELSQLIQDAKFSAAPKSQYASPITEPESTLNAFLFFDRGARILSNYREPQLTRGAKGVSIFRQVSPAVTLVVTGDDKNVDGIGTGVVVDSSGYVLTNWHVIAGHQDAVIFMKPPSGADVDKKYAYYARVAYANPLPDLALLKLVEAPAALPSIAIADISQAEVAEDIHIIGHPHGQFWSYSTGVLSQIRSDYTWKYEDGSQHRAKVLQMQTAINPGNSGGPVVDDSGKLIGLVAMFEEGQNLDYAIAADVIKSFLTQAMSRQTRGRKEAMPASEATGTFAAPVDTGTVYKSEYQGSVVYWMTDKSGASCCLLIQDKKGNKIEASRGTGSGGFSEWKATLGNGEVIRASSKSVFPDVFWIETSPPSK